MLGLRLSPEIERRFERFVRSQGRAKSDVARAAIIEYMDRHGSDREFARQLEAVAESEASQATMREIDDLDSLAWTAVRP